MARNRKRAKERQARRRARDQQRKGDGQPRDGQQAGGGQPGDGARQPDGDPNAGKPGPERRHGGEPIADDVADELERESVAARGGDPPTPPPLSESERLRSGAPPDDVGSGAEVVQYEQDLEAEDVEHYDPAEDVAEDDVATDARRGKEAGEHAHRGRVVQFLFAVWAELQRVQWPDRQALITLTGVVLGFVLIAGGYLGLLDAIASRVIQAII